MTLFSRSAVLLSAVLGVLVAGAGQARAEFLVRLSANGVTEDHIWGTLSGGGSTLVGTNEEIVVFPEYFQGFEVSFTLAETNAPGTSAQAFLSVESFSVMNTNPTTTLTTSSLQVLVSDVGFTAPGTTGSSMMLSSTVSGNLSAPLGVSLASSSLTLQSYADQNNMLFGTSITSGLQSFNPPPPGVVTASIGGGSSGDQSKLFTRSSSPAYSLTSVTTLTLGSQVTISFNGDTEMTDPPPPAPAPAALVLLLTGLPPLGLAGWRRYRRQTAA